MEFFVKYNNKLYKFQYAFEPLIFNSAITYGLDEDYPDELNNYIELVGACYLKDSNPTPLGNLADYMAENWNDIKNLSRYDILDKFYTQF